MNKFAALMMSFSMLVLSGSPAVSAENIAATSTSSDVLFNRVSALDAAVFDAFNHCNSPAELQKHASYFAPDVEFYHDTGGVAWTRKEMIARTKQNVCGHFRRELIPGSLKVYPIKDFGAIEQGMHRFCQFDTGKCDGLADFVIVWRNGGDSWQVTRVLSYGHRASE